MFSKGALRNWGELIASLKNKNGIRKSSHGQNSGICMETPPTDEFATGEDTNIKGGQRKITGAAAAAHGSHSHAPIGMSPDWLTAR
jgi:hypothetical protein